MTHVIRGTLELSRKRVTVRSIFGDFVRFYVFSRGTLKSCKFILLRFRILRQQRLPVSARVPETQDTTVWGGNRV